MVINNISFLFVILYRESDSIPVSYTHLDVYKRQLNIRENFRFVYKNPLLPAALRQRRF